MRSDPMFNFVLLLMRAETLDRIERVEELERQKKR